MTSVLTEPTPPGRGAAHGRSRPRRSGASAFFGVLGELLITIGLLLGLYVVYQLWWTDVMGVQAQEQLSQEWAAGIADSPDVVGEAQVREPTVQELPPITGETFARIWIPAWDSGDTRFVRPITEGTDRATVLDPLGIGHYEQTAMPGEIGNFALAGHRQSHGKPFYDVDKLREGDEIIIETADAWYTYRVTTWDIVMPTEVGVIAPNPYSPGDAPDRATITLTTCHPLFSTRERYIVHGDLESWMPRDAGRPAALVAAA